MSSDENAPGSTPPSPSPVPAPPPEPSLPPLPPNPYPLDKKLIFTVEKGQTPTVTREQRPPERK